MQLDELFHKGIVFRLFVVDIQCNQEVYRTQ